MAEQSEISWTDNTHNEWIGCTRVSPGCQHCYAETLMDTRYGRVKWGKGQPRVLTSEANRRKPLSWDRAAAKAGTRPRVFSASLSDWLDHEVPTHWRVGLLETIRSTPNLDWLLLTKRPESWSARLHESSFAGPEGLATWIGRWLDGEAPANVWVGTTVEDQERADLRVPQLLAIPARVRFLSCEPLLGPVDLGLADGIRAERFQSPRASGLHWIIAGGESGHGARPMHPAWARSLRDQATSAGVAFHMKQWGERLPFCHATPEQIGAHDCQAARFGWDLPVYRVGKKAAGRLLDGREWNEFPSVPRG